MKAIEDTIGIEDDAVEAHKAGADQLLIGHLPEEQLKALQRVEKAVDHGEVSLQRIKESLTRLKKLKEKYVKWSDLNLNETKISPRFNNKEKQALALEAYKKSVTILKSGEVLDRDSKVLVLQPKDELRTIAEDTTEENYILAQTIKKYINHVEIEIVTNHLSEEERSLLLEKSEQFDRVILGTMMVQKEDNILELARTISQSRPLDIISMKSPYVGQWLPTANFWINTYEPSQTPIRLAIQALVGESEPAGKSPVTLTNISEE